ncbi:MAG: fumarylacetoacetate hydrolase family protein [Peptococcales bacterium]|jgi:2-keto-4-pentenoate hydratase/2-oxohepta-3-ene-1,7-dioic acid hydratase in catechol pathway
MRFVTYMSGNKVKYGVLRDEKTLIPIYELLDNETDEIPATLADFIKESDDRAIHAMKEKLNSTKLSAIPLESVKIMAPIPNPLRNIICLGKNYIKHAKEIAGTIKGGGDFPSEPVYFSKLASPAIGPGDYIMAHEGITSCLDYEVELAVVIGRNGRNIERDEAEKYIFGYTIINDVTARDLQMAHGQWFRGKSLDTFCPMGPCILHKSEAPFPVKLDISCSVNGELRQFSNTGDMTFDIGYIISQLSRGIELKAGDIIATGTPQGVGMGFDPPRYLKPGDVVTCTIEKIGTLTNIVK